MTMALVACSTMASSLFKLCKLSMNGPVDISLSSVVTINIEAEIEFQLIRGKWGSLLVLVSEVLLI